MADINKELLVRYRALLRIVEPVREALMNIQDEIEDEGDRVYFGSTNHADLFKRIAQSLDDAKWAEVVTPLKSVSELNAWQLADDIVAANKKASKLELENYDLTSELTRLTAEVERLKAENQRLRNIMSEHALIDPELAKLSGEPVNIFSAAASEPRKFDPAAIRKLEDGDA